MANFMKMERKAVCVDAIIPLLCCPVTATMVVVLLMTMLMVSSRRMEQMSPLVRLAVAPCGNIHPPDRDYYHSCDSFSSGKRELMGLTAATWQPSFSVFSPCGSGDCYGKIGHTRLALGHDQHHPSNGVPMME